MIDLNEARKKRAAERESNGEAPVVKFADREFTLPVELPFEAVEHITRMAGFDKDSDPHEVNEATQGFVRALFGPEYPDFIALRPTTQDVAILMEGVLEEYGLSAGEAQASEQS